MARPKGGELTEVSSTPKAVRIPNNVLDLAYAACGGEKKYPEWLRNVVRKAVGMRLDVDAGYQEGFMAGWSDAKSKFMNAARSVK